MYRVKIHPQNMSPGPLRSAGPHPTRVGYPAAGSGPEPRRRQGDPRVPGRSWVQAARLSTRPEAPEERAGANVG
jgi:hypothetical protein